MKTKLFYLFLYIFAYVSVAKAQSFTDNLKSYQKINFNTEVNWIISVTPFATPFTESNLQSKLTQLFSQKNIPATLVATLTYPCLTVTVDKALKVVNLYNTTAYAYVINLDLQDIINGKKVIVYHYAVGVNTINLKSDDCANTMWDIINELINEFANDWKKTH